MVERSLEVVRIGRKSRIYDFSTKEWFNLPPLSLTLRIFVPITIILALTVEPLFE